MKKQYEYEIIIKYSNKQKNKRFGVGLNKYWTDYQQRTHRSFFSTFYN